MNPPKNFLTSVNRDNAVGAHSSTTRASDTFFMIYTLGDIVAFCVGTLGKLQNLFGASLNAQTATFAVFFAEFDFSFCHN